MPSRCFTSARSELPCAATRTVRPRAQVRDDAVVPVRQQPAHDVGRGTRCAAGISGGSSRVARRRRPARTRRRRSIGGGGVSYERRQSMNCSSPYCVERLLLVLALQRAVVALVEPPRLRATGIQCRSHASSARFARADRAAQHRGVHHVGQHARRRRAAAPPRTASASPFADRSTSTQPVNRFLAFHVLSPWRSRTRVYGASLMARSLPDRPPRRCAGSVRPGLRVGEVGEGGEVGGGLARA